MKLADRMSRLGTDREIVLSKKLNTYELKSRPVKELASIQAKPVSYDDDATLDNPLCVIEFAVKEGSKEFSLILSNDQNEKVTISFDQGILSFDRSASGITNFSAEFSAVHRVDVHDIELRKLKIYVDLASIEVFVNDGERVLTEIVFPTKPYNQVKLNNGIPQMSISNIASTLK